MVSIHDVESKAVIDKAAKELESKLEMPSWAVHVKTGVSRERPPEQRNWYFIRAASILRRIYINGPIGVERLKTYYGGKHRRGHKPAHKDKAGGKIIRTILQDLEKIKFIETDKKGRKITREGKLFLNKVAKGA